MSIQNDVRPGARLEVARAIAPLHHEPRVTSRMISQRVAGHRLEVLGGDGHWLRVRGEDDYEGWMHSGYLRPAADGAPDGRRRISLGCRVRDRATSRPLALPLGALLPPDDEIMVENGEAVTREEQRLRFPRDADAVARTAVARFVGTSYLWGGITPWGADCSGLVQTSFALHGVPLPRDSHQQALVGECVGSDLGALRAGDLLFFSDLPERFVTHVAVALGEMRLVHLALGRGGYAVERLDDRADPYVATLRERFLFARRVVSSPAP